MCRGNDVRCLFERTPTQFASLQGVKSLSNLDLPSFLIESNDKHRSSSDRDYLMLGATTNTESKFLDTKNNQCY